MTESSKVVLIVEDDEPLITCLAEALNAEGYLVRLASDGDHALWALRHGSKPDVILTDIRLPKVDGLTFLKELRQDPALGKIPIVGMSALRWKPDEMTGFDAWIDKPLNLDRLLELLRGAKHAHKDSLSYPRGGI